MHRATGHIISRLKSGLLSGASLVGIIGCLVMGTAAPVSAACQPPATTYGTDTLTASVSTTTTYSVWVQMLAPASTSNSIMLQVDGGTCYNVGGSASMPLNNWTWVNYQNGASSQVMQASFTAGSHSLEFIGTQPGVAINNVLLLANTGCVPTGNGSNCTSGQSDTTKPTVSLTAPANSASVSGSTTISATATDDTAMGTVQFQLDGTSLGSPISSTSSTYNYAWNTATTANGSHQLTAKATDAAGNTTTSSPVTVNVSNSAATTTVQNFRWDPATKSLSWSSFSGAAAYKIATISDPTGTRSPTTYQVPVTGTSYTPPALAGTTVNYGIHPEQKNADGSYADLVGSDWTLQEVTVSWPPSGDSTPPTVSLTAPANGAAVSGPVTISANANDNVGVSKVEFYIKGTLLASTTNSPYATVWNTAAVANGAYTVQAKAYDAAGNIGASSLVSITVNNTDTTPPSTPAGLSAKAISSSQVDLTWSAATDNVGVAQYKVERDGVVVASVNGTSYSDTTVSAASTYSYTIVAADAAGNASKPSTAATATTPATQDTTPPPAPTQLNGSAASSNQVNLTWLPSTDPSGIKGYNVYRNGTKLTAAPVAGTSYGDATALADSTYNYTVTAVDGANNESVKSTQATVTTPLSATSINVGKTTVGPFAGALVDNRKRVNAYSISQAVTFSKIYVYLQPTSTKGQQVLKGIIYADSNRSLQAVSYERTFHSTDAAGWYSMMLTKPVTLQPGKYWIGIITGGSRSVAGFRYSGVTNSRAYNYNSYPLGPRNPFGSSIVLDPDQMSVYASNN